MSVDTVVNYSRINIGIFVPGYQKMETKVEADKTTPEFRRRVVSNFVQDVTEGRIALSIDLEKRRPEDIELISNTSAKLISHLNEYISGVKAGEEQDFLERQLFFCISVLRTYDAFKTKMSETKLENEIRKLGSKVDITNKLLVDTLSVLEVQREQKKRKTRKRTPKREVVK